MLQGAALRRQAQKKPEEGCPSSGQDLRCSKLESSELVVHARAEDRGVPVDFPACNDAREVSRRKAIWSRGELAAAEIGIQIFALDRDVVGNRVFDAATDRPADAR